MLLGFPGCGIWLVYLLIVLLSTNFYFVLNLLVDCLCVMCVAVCLFRWVVGLVFLFGLFVFCLLFGCLCCMWVGSDTSLCCGCA